MKKYLLIPLLLTAAIPLTFKSRHYTIQWEKGKNFPLNLSEIKAITCNNKIYVIGGRINKSTTDFSMNVNVDYNFEYNPGNEEWTKKDSMPFKDYDVALATINDKIFAIGSKTAMYDPGTDKWQLKKPLADGKAHLEAEVVKGRIYVFGFYECPNPGKTMMYDPKEDTWTKVAPVPEARIGPVVATVKDKIYVMGGIGLKEDGSVDFRHRLHRVDIYNPKTNTWESGQSLPESFWSAEGVVVFDNKIFLINVRSGIGHLKDNIYMYNPLSGEWSNIKANLPVNYSELGITLLDNKIYVIGGHDKLFVQHDDVLTGIIEKSR